MKETIGQSGLIDLGLQHFIQHHLEFVSVFQVALVTWTESVGLTLLKRDLNSMQLRAPNGSVINYHILHIFPFTSETKRMGIIVKVPLSLTT